MKLDLLGSEESSISAIIEEGEIKKESNWTTGSKYEADQIDLHYFSVGNFP